MGDATGRHIAANSEFVWLSMSEDEDLAGDHYRRMLHCFFFHVCVCVGAQMKNAACANRKAFDCFACTQGLLLGLATTGRPGGSYGEQQQKAAVRPDPMMVMIMMAVTVVVVACTNDANA
jgi:hypothetical protein